MIPDGTVVGYPPIVDDPAVWPGFCPVDEESGAHVLILDERTVLMAASAVATRVRFEHLGLRVVAVDKVTPHERFHPARLEKLKQRLVAENKLVCP